jgi:[acyl-carrier-protein] S-malonyltransferase
MHNAAIEMGLIINELDYKKPNVEIVMNATAKTLAFDNLPELMMKQIESPVYWEDSIKFMIENYDIDTFIEFGPGNVLSGLMRKIDSSKQTYNISKIEELNILK